MGMRFPRKVGGETPKTSRIRIADIQQPLRQQVATPDTVITPHPPQEDISPLPVAVDAASDATTDINAEIDAQSLGDIADTEREQLLEHLRSKGAREPAPTLFIGLCKDQQICAKVVCKCEGVIHERDYCYLMVPGYSKPEGIACSCLSQALMA